MGGGWHFIVKEALEGSTMANNHLERSFPPHLENLEELALDLRLSGSQTMAHIWEQLDPEAWVRCGNPHMILQNAHQDRLQELAADKPMMADLARWLERRRRYLESPGWFGEHYAQSELKGIAYFSMEFGLSEALPIYSGGLGILAGDHLKSASDLNVPVVGVGLLYQQGYFRQVLADDGGQLEAFPFNDPGSLPVTPVHDADGRWPRVRLELPGRTLLLRVWRVQVGRVTLYLLDSNHPLNSPWDRGITANLYAAGKEKRLLQELVLGIGGWRLLEKLGIEVQVLHLNEGHAAFALLARAASFAARQQLSFNAALWATRAGNVFTTHTPVEAAFDQFEPQLVLKYALPFLKQSEVSAEQLLTMGRRHPEDHYEPFNMAYLALRGCGRSNGVSRLHGRVSRRLFRELFPRWPEAQVPVSYVTNGVHTPTWDSASANQLWRGAYRSNLHWLDHLEAAAQDIAVLSDEQLWQFRALSRAALVQYVRDRLERQLRERGGGEETVQRARHVLDPNFLTLGFARRFTEYKRPNLLLSDPERLSQLLRNADRPVQLIVAGKAHPNDDNGKAMVRAVAQLAWREELRDHVVFLEDYDMVLAQQMTAGVDVWLNTPRRPAEACGTSGMKTLVNGALHLSVLDGWWDEAYSVEVGWELGGGREHNGEHDADDARQLYEILEQQVIPAFYDRAKNGVPHAWIARLRASMSRLTPRFSSNRMLREYVEQAYLPAAKAFLRRVADDCRIARELEQWHWQVSDAWRTLRFGEVRAERSNGQWRYVVQAYLGDVPPDSVRVELYADTPDGKGMVVTMHRSGPIPGAVNGYTYSAEVSAERPSEDFTARLVPYHAEASVPLEAADILWHRQS
jgi:starch phosphorylase